MVELANFIIGYPKGCFMKLLIILFLSVSVLFSNEYYSKVAPYEIRELSSNVSGIVVFSDEDMLGKVLSSKPFIQVDNELDVQELADVEKKIIILNDSVTINRNILSNLKKIIEKKKQNYEAIKNLKVKSKVQKDTEFYALVSSQNLMLSTQKEINSLNAQIADLQLRDAQLNKSINDKSISAKGLTLYSLAVKEGQVVNIATPLAKVADVSKALLTIYLDAKDVTNIKDKIIYINGKKTEYKISRLLHIADSKSISKYEAQIIIKPPKIFSQLVKIELKNKDEK